MPSPENFHESFQRNEDSQAPRSSNRSFGLIVSGALALIGLWPLTGSHEPNWLPLGAAVILLVLAGARPELLAPLNLIWFRIGLLLHKFVNPVLMAVIFIFGVLPTALVMRLMRMDPMRRRFDPEAVSYWIERKPPGPSPEGMKNQF